MPHRVQSKSAVNKMKPENLAALFGPNIFRAKTEQNGDLNNQMEVIKHMVVEAVAVFGT